MRAESLGTLDVGDRPALPEALVHGDRLGLDLEPHRARCVVGRDLSGADLVLGFERRHVDAAVRDAGAPPERTFLLPELVALLEAEDVAPDGDPVERARAAVELAARRRADGPPVRAREVADPIGGTAAAFTAAARDVERLCARLFPLLLGAR